MSAGGVELQASATQDLQLPKMVERIARRMEAMRRLLLVFGLIALAIGLLWIGQGTGTIPWPRSSFMIDQIQWAGYGVALAAFGLVLIWQSNG
jgi:hypothetical protein